MSTDDTDVILLDCFKDLTKTLEIETTMLKKKRKKKERETLNSIKSRLHYIVGKFLFSIDNKNCAKQNVL
jgi:adenylate cyclase class IV